MCSEWDYLDFSFLFALIPTCVSRMGVVDNTSSCTWTEISLRDC